MQVRRLSILGVGLLGGSIALAVRQCVNDCKIAGYGHRRLALARALELGAIDEAYDDPAQAVREADLIIVCTPVGRVAPLLKEIAPHLADGAVVTDVGSTKRSIMDAGHAVLQPAVKFVGSHPIAGSEKRGVEFARPDLFQGAMCITTPTDQTDAAALERVESFWQLLGMRITRMSPADHDRLLAQISHLPHAIAAALVSMQDEVALQLCGKGFLDLTRIAAGDAGLWRDILLDNRDNVVSGLDRLEAQLQTLRRMISSDRDGAALQQWLASAAARRQRLERPKSE